MTHQAMGFIVCLRKTAEKLVLQVCALHNGLCIKAFYSCALFY